MWCTFWCTVCIKNLHHFCPKQNSIALAHRLPLLPSFSLYFFCAWLCAKYHSATLLLDAEDVIPDTYSVCSLPKLHCQTIDEKSEGRTFIYRIFGFLFFPTRRNSVFLSFLFVDFSAVLLCVCCLPVFKRIDECLNSTFELFSQFTVTDPLGFLYILLLLNVVCVIRTQ